MDSKALLIDLLIGIICGLLGQAIRVAVGMKKTNDEATAQTTTVANLFDWSQFIVSLFLGASAGGLAAIAYVAAGKVLDQSAFVPLITAGYAGADFIEGLISNATTQASGAAGVPPLAGLPGVNK
jgi:hypothetical protein